MTVDNTYFNVKNSPLFMIHAVSLKVTRLLFNSVIKPHGITMQEWRIILFIAYEQPTTAAELSAETGMQESHVSTNLVRLTGNGLIQRVASKTDGRVRELSLADKGQRLFGLISPEINRFGRSLWEDLDESGRDGFRNTLRLMDDRLEELLMQNSEEQQAV